MDPVGSFIHRVMGRASPRLKADLQWRRSRRGGDFAMRVVDLLVKPGDMVLDIGAGWGLYAQRLARLAGATGSVHAFEPNPVFRRSLTRIAARVPQLHVHTVALSDHAGEADLNVPDIGSRPIAEMGTLSPPSRRQWAVGVKHRVPLARLDDVIPDCRPAFIKCDVEGHELAVLEGARNVVRRCPAILMEIEQRHHDHPIDEVFRCIEAFGYDLFPIRPEGLVPLGDFDVIIDQTAHLFSKSSLNSGEPAEYVKDFLLLPKGKPVPERLVAGSADNAGDPSTVSDGE